MPHHPHHTRASNIAANLGHHLLCLCHMVVAYANSGSFSPDTKSPPGCPSITLETAVTNVAALSQISGFSKQQP
jgi:hypothetical protein